MITLACISFPTLQIRNSLAIAFFAISLAALMIVSFLDQACF